MNQAPLLDTHSWVWWIRRDPRLDDNVIERLDAFPADDRPLLADISLWEVAMANLKGRLDLPRPVGEWLESASHARAVRIVPISAAIAAETHVARALRDPVDRLIVATSRILRVPLFTYYRNILRSRLVQRWTP